LSGRPWVAILSLGNRPKGEPLRETRSLVTLQLPLPAVSDLHISSSRKQTGGRSSRLRENGAGAEVSNRRDQMVPPMRRLKNKPLEGDRNSP